MADAVSEVFLFRKPQKACWRCATNLGRGKAKRRATGKYIPAGEVGFEVSLAKNAFKMYYKTEEHKACCVGSKETELVLSIVATKKQ